MILCKKFSIFFGNGEILMHAQATLQAQPDFDDVHVLSEFSTL